MVTGVPKIYDNHNDNHNNSNNNIGDCDNVLLRADTLELRLLAVGVSTIRILRSLRCFVSYISRMSRGPYLKSLFFFI